MFHAARLAAISRNQRQRPIAKILRFRRSIGFLSLLACLISMGGCRLCSDCDLDAYPAYGGTWQRTNRESGRVGSLFDPGGSRAADLSARADSDENDARNRERYGDNESADVGNDARSDDAGEEPQNEDADARQDDPDLDLEDREMQERFRNLELQQINYRSPAVSPSKNFE